MFPLTAVPQTPVTPGEQGPFDHSISGQKFFVFVFYIVCAGVYVYLWGADMCVHVCASGVLFNFSPL